MASTSSPALRRVPARLRPRALWWLLAALPLAGCTSLGPIVEDFAACRAAEELFARDMSSAPLFARVGGSCRALTPAALDEAVPPEVFGDAACTRPVPYAPTSFEAFCFDNLLGSDRSERYVGNPLAWGDLDPAVTDRIETRWTLSRGATLRVAAVDQTKANLRPYLKKVEYRRLDGCVLGVHVYTRHPLDAGLRPAVFFHGGGWKLRGTGAIAGIETAVPNLTERGFVVFAPFYRLLGSSDGPEACRGADGRAILDDAEAALDWVFDHGEAFGMDPRYAEERRAWVLGQSAGAHLAAYLATQRPDEVERGVLLYPPTDFRFILDNLQPGGLFEDSFEDGRELLLQFLRQPGITAATDLDAADPLVIANSFPERINADPGSFPPLTILHGDGDSVVPVENATRLCAARDPDQTPAATAYPGGGDRRSCGTGGELTVVAGAGHVLDLRCVTGDAGRLLSRLYPELEALCPSGGRAGERRVREALERAYGTLGSR
ncbi:MAG: alpha/beta hydrolase [Acidobacteriota bacterium]